MTYIAPRAKVLRHLDRFHAWDQGQTPGPVTLEVDLSNRCVLGCQSCHMAHTHSRGPWTGKLRTLGMAPMGDLADTAVTMRWLAEAKEAGVQAIVWSGGGEPTTHPDWLPILARAHTLGFQQGMYTLGGLLTQATALEAAHYLEWVVVSLDCADADTYAKEKAVPPTRFHAACHGIRYLASANACTVGVSYLLHRDNWQRMGAMYQLSKDLGATYTTFRPTIEVRQDAPGTLIGQRGWVFSDAQQELAYYATLPDVELDPTRFTQWAAWAGHGYPTCYGIRLNATVTPNGHVWVCVNRRGVPDSSIGDLTTQSFGEVWAKHPGHWMVDAQCRAMCRLHPINQELAALAVPQPHEAFL